MNLTIDFAPLHATRILCALAVLLQTIELLALRPTYRDNGIWRWGILHFEFEELPAPVRLLFAATLPYRHFLALLMLRLFAAAAFFFISNLYLSAFLLASTLLISIRWRGAFNGGSDYMTTIILSSLTLADLFPNNPNVYLGCVYYITIQACLSYFVSGMVKLRSPNWRSGAALHAFLCSSAYAVPAGALKALRHRIVAPLLSWTLMLFECAFPLALVNRQLAVCLLACGATFHLINVFLLGLNRFFFIWIATYPAIFWCSGR